MGNTNEIVATYVSEEEFNELLRREKHKKKKRQNYYLEIKCLKFIKLVIVRIIY